ncbi:MAG: tetratricopeptide repeat protein [Actinomycetota bacterium]|nr:tetratricopeptide repeat protein [Actinomycetota bacterium]
MSEHPTGTVTFVFTDIQGSTAMWERDAEAMRLALARHDAILRRLIEKHGGHVFKMMGDACCAAFPTAPDALDAALDAQRALFAEQWDKIGSLRVRIALHTGDVTEERGEDYFGPPLNRVARLLAAGHGGQVLLSMATQELVRGELPEGTELRNLGERRLKDLIQPERVFQLVAPDLPSSFPPLRTLDARLNNLPIQPTSIVGREKEVVELCGFLRRQEVRLLTLTGPGGTGKTRVALQSAAELIDEFESGVFFVALAPISDPNLVASTIATHLGVVESAERSLEESLKNHLRGIQLLLVLDNFEQVLEAAPLVGGLLSACPQLKVLTTSRIRLRLYGEREYPVPPLDLPDLGYLPVERLTQYGAVRLFTERAQDAKPDFSITDESAPAVAEICVRLDGLPLAIELAAARIKLLPPQTMVKKLGHRLKLLTGGPRDLPERQRTLWGTIEWSHDLLEEGEKMLFARLAVFSGGRTLEAIEAVCDAEGDLPIDVLDGVSSLVDENLLRQEEAGSEPRFVMLETIHEYARERLEESGVAEALRRSHAEYFLAIAEEAEPELSGPQQRDWLERLEVEHDNLRGALSWSLGNEPETALQLAGTLARFWEIRSRFLEGSRWLEAALRQSGRTEAATRAPVLTEAGTFAWHRGDYERSGVLHRQALALYRQQGDEGGIAFSLNCLGNQQSEKGDDEGAVPLLEEALALSRRIGDRRTIAYALHNLAEVARHRGDYEQAKTLGLESLALLREMADKWQLARITGWLGMVTVYNSDDHDAAARFLKESLALNREIGSWEYVAYCLEGFAGLAGARTQGARAARLWGAAEALRETISAPLPPADRPDYDRSMATARAHLGEVPFAVAWEGGKAMTPDEAIEYALE